MYTISDEDYWNILKERISAVTGFNADQYSEKFVKRRTECRMRIKKMVSYSNYAKLLLKDKKEVEELHKILTIHVTHLFRDASMFGVLQNKVLPEIINVNKSYTKNPIIRIWSAGCATGEEPISVLISILEKFGTDTKLFFSIRGSDIDPDSIKKAKVGIYENIQFKETKGFLIRKYFEKKETSYSIKDEYKHYINYKVGDITKDTQSGLDIIMCRNTVIYFHSETKKKLYKSFFTALNPGGFLILGKTETLLGESMDSYDVYDLKERIYRKPL